VIEAFAALLLVAGSALVLNALVNADRPALVRRQHREMPVPERRAA
jgi:hypothetical protein